MLTSSGPPQFVNPECGCYERLCDHWGAQNLAAGEEELAELEKYAARWAPESRVERAVRARRQVEKWAAKVEKARAFYASEAWQRQRARWRAREKRRLAWLAAPHQVLTVIRGGLSREPA